MDGPDRKLVGPEGLTVLDLVGEFLSIPPNIPPVTWASPVRIEVVHLRFESL